MSDQRAMLSLLHQSPALDRRVRVIAACANGMSVAAHHAPPFALARRRSARSSSVVNAMVFRQFQV